MVENSVSTLLLQGLSGVCGLFCFLVILVTTFISIPNLSDPKKEVVDVAIDGRNDSVETDKLIRIIFAVGLAISILIYFST